MGRVSAVASVASVVLIASFIALLVACLKAPSPAQQVQDFATVEACVAAHWGEPITQLAADCLNGEEALAADVIADIELLAEARGDGGTLPSAYASDTRVAASLAKKRAARAAAPIHDAGGP